MDQSRARRTPSTDPEKTPNPTNRLLKVVSAEVSLPPAALGAWPPMSNLKPLPPRLRNRTATTATAAAMTMAPMSRMVPVLMRYRPFNDRPPPECLPPNPPEPPPTRASTTLVMPSARQSRTAPGRARMKTTSTKD